MDDARKWYRAFHAGKRPTIVNEFVRTPQWFADMGPAVAIAYLRPTPHGEELRVHPWAPHARPTLVRNDLGELDFVGGAYTVKEAGIVDAAMVRRDPREGMKALTATRFTPQGIAVHGRATPREGVMIPRANPMGLVELREGGSRLLDAGVIGGTALVTAGVSDLAAEATTWGEGARSAAQVAAGLALGVPLLLTDANTVGAGLIVGGMVAGGLRFGRSRQWDRTAALAIRRWWPSLNAAPARDGAALFDEDTGGADVRVEASAMAGG